MVETDQDWYSLTSSLRLPLEGSGSLMLCRCTIFEPPPPPHPYHEPKMSPSLLCKSFSCSLIFPALIECPHVPSTLPGSGDTTMAKMDAVRTIPMSLRGHLLASSCQSLHPWAHGCFLEPIYRAVGSARELKPSESSSQAKTGWTWCINTPAPLPLGTDLSEMCFLPSWHLLGRIQLQSPLEKPLY